MEDMEQPTDGQIALLVLTSLISALDTEREARGSGPGMYAEAIINGLQSTIVRLQGITSPPEQNAQTAPITAAAVEYLQRVFPQSPQ